MTMKFRGARAYNLGITVDFSAIAFVSPDFASLIRALMISQGFEEF